jgi:NAD(P)H-hydrate epimerase
MQKIDLNYVSERLPYRDENCLKDSFGKLLVVGGSVGYTGSVYLTATAAVHSGCGLVYVGVPQTIWQVEAIKLTEAMPFPLRDSNGQLTTGATSEIISRLDKCDALAIGPGLGRSEETCNMVLQVLAQAEKPVVVDADALFALSGNLDVLDQRKGRITVLTPHPGEYSRLTGGADVPYDSFAREHECYLVAKQHRTIVAGPDGKMMVNTSGNSGLAKGGSGDVLTGFIGSLICQGTNPFDACAAGVYLHGRAGDLVRDTETAYCMSPEQVIFKGFRDAFIECLANEL